MCVSLKVQMFALVFSYQGCVDIGWVGAEQALAAPEVPQSTEFWAERIDSTDTDEDGYNIYIFKNPATNRKTDAAAACGDTGPQERKVGDVTEVKGEIGG